MYVSCGVADDSRLELEDCVWPAVQETFVAYGSCVTRLSLWRVSAKYHDAFFAVQ